MGPSESPPMSMHLFLQDLSAGGGGRDSKAMSDGLLLY